MDDSKRTTSVWYIIESQWIMVVSINFLKEIARKPLKSHKHKIIAIYLLSQWRTEKDLRPDALIVYIVASWICF